MFKLLLLKFQWLFYTNLVTLLADKRMTNHRIFCTRLHFISMRGDVINVSMQRLNSYPRIYLKNISFVFCKIEFILEKKLSWNILTFITSTLPSDVGKHCLSSVRKHLLRQFPQVQFYLPSLYGRNQHFHGCGFYYPRLENHCFITTRAHQIKLVV